MLRSTTWGLDCESVSVWPVSLEFDTGDVHNWTIGWWLSSVMSLKSGCSEGRDRVGTRGWPLPAVVRNNWETTEIFDRHGMWGIQRWYYGTPARAISWAWQPPTDRQRSLKTHPSDQWHIRLVHLFFCDQQSPFSPVRLHPQPWLAV